NRWLENRARQGRRERRVLRTSATEDAGERRFAGSSGARPPQPLRQRLARDPLVGLLVALPRTLDHLVRQRGCRGRLVPPRGARPVAHVLLVEGGLGAA